MKRTLITVAILAVLVSSALAPRVFSFVERRFEMYERSTVKLPPKEGTVASVSSSEASSSQSLSSSKASTLRAAVNWDVPFTPQAPLAVWDYLHQEACEEASVLMALQYFQQKEFDSPEHADSLLTALVHKNEALGFPVDDTAEQLKTLLLSEDPTLSVSLLHDPTVPDLKKALSDGKLVIVPAAGRLLGNPYFQQPGPIYHVLLLRGYTADGKYVITNDPGTKRGEEFVYTWDRILSANHDWNGGEVEGGERVMLVVSQ